MIGHCFKIISNNFNCNIIKGNKILYANMLLSTILFYNKNVAQKLHLKKNSIFI